MSLWYAHRLTTVLLVWGQDVHLFEYEQDASGVLQRTERTNEREGRGWPYYEPARCGRPGGPAREAAGGGRTTSRR